MKYNGSHHRPESVSLPPGWASSRLGELGRYLNGRGFKKSEWGTTGRPIIRIQDLTGTSANPNYFDGDVEERHVARHGDFLISWAATLGAYIYHGPEALVNQHIFKVETFINQAFHFYAVTHAIEDMYRRTRGTGMVHIVKADFDNTEIPLPPLAEQERIADRIDELFTDLSAGVAALERVKRNLSRYRAAVLHAAVTGRLTEAWRKDHGPADEPGPKLLERILAERRRQWEERTLAKYEKDGKKPPKDWKSCYKEPVHPTAREDGIPLPELPDGWCWARAEQVTSIIQYGTSAKTNDDVTGVPVLRMGNITSRGTIDFTDLKYLPADHSEFPDLFLDRGDLLFNRTNSAELVGKTAVFDPPTDRPMSLASYLIRVRAICGCSPWWLTWCVISPTGHQWLRRVLTHTAGQANVNGTKLGNYVIPLPPESEQAAIVDAASEKLSQIDALKAEVERGLKRADRLRQAILKAAFEGKLVSQNASDEPASVLLERIRTQSAEQAEPAQLDYGSTKKTRGRAKRSERKEPRGIYFKRAAVAACAVRALANSKFFGRTQLEKVLYLAQTHIGIDLSLQFKRKAAGPYDEAIHKIESLADKRHWFQTKPRPHVGVQYEPGAAIDERCRWVEQNLSDKRAELDSLLSVFKKMKTEQAELFATVYAAWNDLLADGRSANPDAVVSEVHGWHESKQRFEPQRIKQCINWMKKHSFVPRGERRSTIAEGVSE
ncbi:MAG: restriction endonuclease subunit S [Phycisphaeraceae bacterium]|nr:restriction endonuclease subunit S [Phycisphaeraceae bacterium]